MTEDRPVKLEQRVAEAFSDAGVKPYTGDYLAEVRTNWRDAEKEIRRVFALVLLLIVIFELSVRGVLEDVSIGVAKITDLGLVRGGIPLVVAYLFNTILALTADVSVFVNVHNYAIATAYPKLADTSLAGPLFPSNSLVYSQLRVYEIVGRKLANTIFGTFVVRLGVMYLLPVAFEIYAYVSLMKQYGATNFLVLASLVVSVILIATGVVLVAVTATVTVKE